jgi:hypothetical protein
MDENDKELEKVFKKTEAMLKSKNSNKKESEDFDASKAKYSDFFDPPDEEEDEDESEEEEEDDDDE